MKYVVISLCVVILIFIAVFLSGPRVEIEAILHPVSLPHDLDEYLAISEGAFTDLIPGTEKTIVWSDEIGASTPYSVVYLHGFSASRQETAPLSDRVAEKLGANLFYARFTGHGRGGEAMTDGSVNNWLNDAYEAIEIGRRLGEQVIVIGNSTGGTAATWLATQSIVKNVSAIVLISPNFAPADPMADILLWPWGRHLAEFIVGPERTWEPDNAPQAMYWTHRYPTRALLPMMGLVKLTTSLDLSVISTPMLVIYSPNDQVVNARTIESTFAKIGSSEKQLIAYTESENPSQHILAGDIFSPGSTEALATMIVDFIKNN